MAGGMDKDGVDAYLARIGYAGSRAPTAATLRAIHRAHQMAIPFENLDIHLGRPIVLDEERLLDKVVTQGRGGFCYELNGLFAALLRALGFPVTLLSAGVKRADGTFGPDFDHMTLLVEAEGRWLADVGYGAGSFLEPLSLVEDHVQKDPDGRFKLAREGIVWTVLREGRDLKYAPEYAFTLVPRELREFEPMSHYHQTSHLTTFTRKRVCTRPTPTGRLTLTDMRLSEQVDGTRTERTLRGDDEWRAALAQRFGVRLLA